MRRLTPARVACAAALLAALALAAAYLFDPARRLEAAVRGYPTFQGRSAAAWSDDLNARDDVERSLAFEKLRGGGAEAVPALAWVLRSSGRPEARWHAADLLGQAGADGRAAAGTLVAALDDPDPTVRGAAQKSLARLAPAAAEPLPPALEGVVPALVGKFPETEAIRAAAAYKRHAAGAVPALAGLLGHADPAARWNAARALGKIGEASRSAAAAIVAQMNDPVPLVREHAAEALGDIGPAVAEFVPDLAKALGDPDWKVRRDAVRALGQMGPAAKGVLPQLQALKVDPESGVREAATDAERKIDPSLAGRPKR